MDFEKIKQTMTKEEFLNNRDLTHRSGCPRIYVPNSPRCKADCRKCWEKAIETNNVKFKDDNTKEQKVIEALKIVKDYCNGKFCSECKFGIYGGSDCIISKGLESSCPISWGIKPIEYTIKPKVTIYKVEHREGEQRYSFISDEKLSLMGMVVCDTCKGKSYGKVVAICKDIDDGYKKCWKVK